MIGKSEAPRWHKISVRAGYALGVVGIVVGIATLVAAVWVMEAFVIEIREWVVAKNNPGMLASFEATVAIERSHRIGILPPTLLVASLSIGAGFVMLRKSK
jgi:hypothetical protein